MSRKLKVAVVQASPVSFNLQWNLTKVRDLTQDMGAQGAKLVVFPEAFLSAYSRRLNFNPVVAHRDWEGRERYRSYWDSSVDLPGPAVDALSDIARENRVQLVIDAIERAAARSIVRRCFHVN